jgi:hypothetical protein
MDSGNDNTSVNFTLVDDNARTPVPPSTSTPPSDSERFDQVRTTATYVTAALATTTMTLATTYFFACAVTPGGYPELNEKIDNWFDEKTPLRYDAGTTRMRAHALVSGHLNKITEAEQRILDKCWNDAARAITTPETNNAYGTALQNWATTCVVEELNHSKI